jgi:Zn-dependent protease
LLILLNLFLVFFNVIPIHPLDGSKLFFALFDAPRYARLREFVAVRGPQALLGLIVLSLVTNFDVFFFVSRPAFAACDLLLGDSCAGFYGAVFR